MKGLMSLTPEPPKGFCYPSQFVAILRERGITEEPAASWLPTALSAQYSAELRRGRDEGWSERFWAFYLEVQLAEMCHRGLFAWRPGSEPVQLQTFTFITDIYDENGYQGTYPDTLYFSAEFNLIKANRNCNVWNFAKTTSNRYGGREDQNLLESIFSGIDLYQGHYALFRNDEIEEQLACTYGVQNTAARVRPGRPVKFEAEKYIRLLSEALECGERPTPFSAVAIWEKSGVPIPGKTTTEKFVREYRERYLK
ncbi:hypothetical protein [Pseudooceanicola sp. MF1-13]|uniref:hypothetical protein n=1 Tax=Pseudooceanicola sp. MF1-13 TaxID=3379095 RepID=UPI0038928E9B